MPNRLIKDSIHESERINALNDFQFRVWVNLITYVDDYGRGDARPAIIKGRCFPLREEITAKNIDAAIQHLAAAGCIRLYSVNGMHYLCFPNWDVHQRIRTKVSKFPAPDTACGNLQQIAADCDNAQQNVSLNPNPNPESESKSETVTEVAAHDCGEGDVPSFNTIEAYASGNLQYLSPGNMEELVDFMNELPDDVIRYAIDIACANGVRKWGYVRSILQAWVEAGVKTLGAAKAETEKKPQNKAQNKPAAQDYQQHQYTDDDFKWNDLERLYGGG